MKQTILTLTLIFGFTLSGFSQIITIPDNNLKNKLLSASSTNQVARNAMNQWVKIDTNNNGEIEISEALLIYQLFVNSSNVSDVTGLESFTNLRNLNCSNNSITSINLTSLTFLSTLNCSSNQLTTLNIINNSNLGTLNCSNNLITSLNLSNKPYLGQVNCDLNQIVTLDTTQNPQLFSLECDNNLLENLSINNPELWFLSCDFNQLTTLDVSQSQITNLTCSNNNLEVLIIKNNLDFTWQNLAIGFNPDLYYVCCDEADIAYVEQIIDDNDYSAHVNTYCSYNPGGIYNTITGKVFYDFNNNGCDINDITRYTKVNINDGSQTGASFTNFAGDYLFFTQDGNFTVLPQIENSTYFNINPTSTSVNFPIVDNSIEIVDFCITPNGVHNDLEVIITPITPARPGFDAVYKIVYRNIGNQIVDGYVNFSYNQDVLDLVSTSVEPTLNFPETGQLSWVIPNIYPFESESIIVTLNVNSPTDTPAVNIGDVLNFIAFIDVETDENWDDNGFEYNQIVVGAYDPNDITCVEGDLVSPDLIGEELHYVIRFENTGNFYAENVVVVMDIDEAKYDVSSLKVLNSSHDMRAQVRGNKAEFIFSNIYLDSGGHGNILLVMNSKHSLTNGDFVKSKADIYFDYNYPVITNEAETLFQALNVVNPVLDNIISIYPNPTNDVVNITVKDNSIIKTIELFDIQGRLLQTQLVNNITSELNLSSRANGMYFIKITTDLGSKVEKLIKE